MSRHTSLSIARPVGGNGEGREILQALSFLVPQRAEIPIPMAEHGGILRGAMPCPVDHFA